LCTIREENEAMMGREASFRLLRKLVRESQADQTEAVLLTEDSGLTRFAASSIHQHVAEKNASLILRVVMGKRVAVVTTNLLGAASLRDLLDRALALARVQQPNEAFVSLPERLPLPEAATFSERIRELTPARKATLVRDLFRLVGEKGCTASGAFSHGAVEVAVVNSRGVEAYQQYSDLLLHVIAGNGTNTGYAGFVSRDPGNLDLPGLAAEAVQKVSDAAPADIEAGEYEVILGPYAVAEMISFLGYLGFNALALQEERSFFCGRLGEKMVDGRVTLYDDGLDPAGLQVPFDFEGVPKRKVVFFDRGVAREVTYDSFTAGRAGRRSTGHGLIAPATEGPVPVNLFMEPGTSTMDEMVRPVRKGVYVTRFHYTNVMEPMSAVITGMTRDGTFLIEGGEITRPVKNLRFTESVLGALSRVTALTRDRKLCSEGTVYSRRFVTGTVVPAIRVDGFTFSGVSSL
jgi:PmbA protein